MKPVKIQVQDLLSITRKVQSKSDSVTGLYLLNGYRIQISKYKLDNGDRVKLLYQKRREQGLCIVCGTKVRKTNPNTGKLYRLCETHRQLIDKKNK